MSEQWVIMVRSHPIAVSGFAKSQATREHVAKHYLSLSERWDQIQPSARESIARGREIIDGHGEVSPAYYAFLDETSVEYLSSVRTETESAVRVEPVTYTDQRGLRVQRIDAVTKLGVYAAFSVASSDRVSDLRTAMRQYPRSIKNPRSTDYRDWAHERLRARLRGSRFTDD